jgi:hypothetical protein
MSEERRSGMHEAVDKAAATKIKQMPSPVDSSKSEAEDTGMNSPTREEYDAKIKALEAGVNTRLVSIEKSIENGFAKMQSDMHKEISSQTKWIMGLVATVMSLGIAVSTYISNLNRQPAAAPIPAVIVVPTGAASTPVVPALK